MTDPPPGDAGTAPGPGRLEREVKARVADLEACRLALRGAGAEPVEGPHVEDDLVLDDENGSLRARDLLLRVRRKLGADRRGGIVTFKGPARIERGIRLREEIETSVADVEAVLAVLAHLGWAPSFRYQKRRSLHRLGDALVALDETPLGPFVEVEGSDEAIAHAASLLGLDEREFLTESYPDLWRREHGPSPPPMLLEPDRDGP